MVSSHSHLHPASGQISTRQLEIHALLLNTFRTEMSELGANWVGLTLNETMILDQISVHFDSAYLTPFGSKSDDIPVLETNALSL